MNKLIELKNAIKCDILFRTEDGVDIFEGVTIYGINNDWDVFSHFTDLQNKVKSWGIKPIFSTREKAEAYIIVNKPVLSLKDVATIYKGINKKTNHSSSQANQLKELVRNKIQQSV